MSTLRTLIADDEPAALRGARRALAACPGIDIVAECANAPAALEAAARLRPDLLVLDIEMPGGTGLDVLRRLGPAAPPAILLTAYDRYAIDAFDLPVCGYVLKPIEADRLARAVERARARQPRRPALTSIPVPGRQGCLLLPVAELDRITAADNYVELHHAGRAHLLAETIAHLETQLPDTFLRIHRGTIVNLARVRALRRRPSGDFDVELTSGAICPVGRSYRMRVQRLRHLAPAG